MLPTAAAVCGKSFIFPETQPELRIEAWTSRCRVSRKSLADGPLRRPLPAHQCTETGHLYQYVFDLRWSCCLPGGYSPCCAAASRQSSEKLCDPVYSTPSQDWGGCGPSTE